MSQLTNELLITITEKLERIDARLAAIERSQDSTPRMAIIEVALRRIHAIATNDTWNVEGHDRDRSEIAHIASEALESGTHKLSEGRDTMVTFLTGEELQP